MKQSVLSFLVIVFAAGISGCTLESSDSNVQEPPVDPVVEKQQPPSPSGSDRSDPKNLPVQPGRPEGPETPSDASTAPDSAVEAATVMIRLDDEPRIQSPLTTLTTLVPPSDQSFTLQFSEPMDRDSVELALREHIAVSETADADPAAYALAFTWHSGTELQLRVDVPEQTTLHFGGSRYEINVNGAKTAKGIMLPDPPVLRAVIFSVNQLWKVSADGKKRQKLSDFNQPSRFEMPDRDGMYALKMRNTFYCECDATPNYLYSVYDLQSGSLVPYPNKLMTNYAGPGMFYADSRGFFYSEPEAGTVVPASDTVTRVEVDGYVYGAQYSQDEQYIVMAVSRSREQLNDLDLVIYNMRSGEQQRWNKALIGEVEQSQVSSARLPVRFHDNGEYVYFTMSNPESFGEKRYQFNWETQKVEEWEPPLKNDGWSGFNESSDGMYRIYYNGGLFKNGQQVSGEIRLHGTWLPGTHFLAYTASGEQSDTLYRDQLKLFNADTLRHTTIVESIPINSDIVGTSSDGQWIYIQTAGDLNKSD